MSPARITKIDPATLLTIDQWTGPSGINNCDALTYDGTYIYAGLELSPARVYQFGAAAPAPTRANGLIPHRLVGEGLI